MRLLDGLGVVLMRLDRRRLGVFPEGWGDPVGIEALGDLPAPDEPVGVPEILWGRKEEHPGFRVWRGQMASPAAPLLPPDARVVSFELCEPGTGSERICILFPAWNDHGLRERRKLARLLVERRVAALSFEAPYYGTRRVVPEPAQAIRTVADFARMGHAAVVEGRALATALADRAQVGVAGYSMGGNLAALVSAALPFPVATAPLAASHSPAPVFCDGVLRHAIAWKALGGRDRAEDLRATLARASVRSAPALPHHAAAVLVAGRSDAYVPAEATQDLARHWPGSELRWVDASHASLLWRHRPLLADAIAESFTRLAAHTREDHR